MPKPLFSHGSFEFLWPCRKGERLCLIVGLLATAISCGRSQPDAKNLAQRYIERLVETRDRVTDQEELVHYFDASWTAVAWEVLAEQQRQAYLRDARDGWMPSVAGTMDLIDAADQEARLIFFRRFCVAPPERYFPPLASEVSSIFEAGAAYQRSRWPVLLREQGLTEVSQIDSYIERCREDKGNLESLVQRADELAEARGLNSHDAFTALEVEEILAVLSPGRPVNMRLLPHTEELDILVQSGLAMAETSGADVEWILSPLGVEALRRQPPLEVALSAIAKALVSRFYVTGPLRQGRYVGIGRVVEVGYAEPFGPLTGTSRWIAVEMLEGVSYHKTPYFAGETIPAVIPEEFVIQVDPSLEVGDRVGYREIPRPPRPDEWPESVWEKISSLE